jgi:hypothetical protein
MMGYGYGSGDQRVNAVVDMINGGGQGRAGQQFEGGGLLSMLGNAFAQPYGAEARGAQAPASSMQPMARPASFATAMPIQSTMPAPVQMPAFQPPVPVQTSYLDPQFDLERILAGLNQMQDPRMVGPR